MPRRCLRYFELNDDDGVSLIEAAIAIIVLGIVLVGLFPLVLDSIRLSVQNAEVAQANRIVASQLDLARTAMATAACAPESSQVLPLSGTNNEKFSASRTVTCTGKLATVTVDVRRLATPTTVSATATTKVATG